MEVLSPINCTSHENISGSPYYNVSDASFSILSPDFTIPQLDGVDSPPSFSISPLPSTVSSHPGVTLPLPRTKSNVGTSTQPVLSSVINAAYKLDRKKQLKRLQEDTALSDFKIEVSTNKQNVNIECNSGFYSTVALPALRSLSLGGDKEFNGITINCQDIVGNFDATQAQQNTVLYFRLNQDKKSLGRVRIHLHHTVRKVQLQGGAVMPDQRTAPIWFADHVLRKNFTQLSQEKAIDISEYNRVVNEMVAKYLRNDMTAHVCAGCELQFNGRSSPEQCSKCKLFFHKSKCLPSNKHTCYGRPRAKSCGMLSQTITDVTNTQADILSSPSLPSTAVTLLQTSVVRWFTVRPTIVVYAAFAPP